MTRPTTSSSSAPTETAAAEQPASPPPTTSLAPGFRFHPTDEELVFYYLKRKVLGRPLKVDAIAEVDLYKLEPWDLPARSRRRRRDAEWYFFSPLDRKHSNRARTNRATAGGYWKTTGKDREVRHGARVVGMKKTLVFHAGRAPRGERTNWVMHEYRLEGEEATLAGIPQDSYVVCRIFQKSGPGPQNGAQYGAPFMEEEWEEEEEEVGLLPVGRDGSDDEVHGAQEAGYLQMNDLFQDSGNGDENGTLPAPVYNEANNSNQSEVVDRNSGDILNDPNIVANLLQYVDEPGECNSLFVHENMVSNASAGDFSYNSSNSDGYLELKDFADAANLEAPLANDSTIWPSDGWPWTAPVNQDLVNGAYGSCDPQGICNGEFQPIPADNTFQPEELQELLQLIQEDSQMDSSVMNPPISCTTNSGKPEDEGLMLYDATIGTLPNDNFRQLNEFVSCPATNLAGMDMADDGMSFYDAIDDNLLNDILGSVKQSEGISSRNGSVLTREGNNTISTYNPTQKVLGPNFVVGAPSSARIPEAGSELNFKNDYVVVPDAQSKSNAIGRHFVRMLDSISAPPAFAAEFPSNLKSVAPISEPHPSAIRVSKVISIGSLRVAARAENWPLQKNEDIELLFSTGFEPGSRMHCGCNAITMVLRGGFCLFFLSAIMLLVSYKVGLCIYGK